MTYHFHDSLLYAANLFVLASPCLLVGCGAGSRRVAVCYLRNPAFPEVLIGLVRLQCGLDSFDSILLGMLCQGGREGCEKLRVLSLVLSILNVVQSKQ